MPRWSKAHLVLFGVVATVSAFLVSVGASAGERLALLIGNSRYEFANPLRNPENDVALVAQSLQKAGFKTFVKSNLTLANSEAAINEFVAAANAAPGSTLLVYFAGHGVQVAGKNYVIPIDARIDTADALYRVSLDVDALLARLATVASDLQIVILDACRDDPFENKTRGLARGLKEIAPVAGRLIAYSTAPGSVAQDGDAGVSPYAAALAEAIVIPGLSLEDAFKRVRATVRTRTQGKQEPWETAALYVPFVFIPETSDAADRKAEEEYWNLASFVNSPEAYQKYVELYPNGIFVELARLKIESINKDFTYRRRADRFQIVNLHRTDLHLCETSKPAPTLPANLTAVLKQLADQIVLIDLVIKDDMYDPVCGRNGDQLGEDSRFSKVVSNDIETETISFPKADDYLQIQPDPDSNGTWYRGFVQIKSECYEDGCLFTLQSVDLNKLGLTWKSQNTVAFLAADPGFTDIMLDAQPSVLEPAGISSFWSHNGSIMGLRKEAERRTIVYLKARDALAAVGVTADTVLFEGKSSDGHAYRGIARTFSKGCASVAYAVVGRVTDDNRKIVLTGKAPVLNERCRRISTRSDTLVFDFLGTPKTTTLSNLVGGPPAEPAAPDDPLGQFFRDFPKQQSDNPADASTSADDGKAVAELHSPHVLSPPLGLRLVELTRAERSKYRIGDDIQGVLVADVAAGSAADGKLQAGDVIVEVSQEPVVTPAEAERLINVIVNDASRKSALFMVSNGSDPHFVAVRFRD